MTAGVLVSSPVVVKHGQITITAHAAGPPRASDISLTKCGTKTSTQPVNEPVNARTGNVSHMFGFSDWYERAHVHPSPLDLGNVSGNVTRNLYVWNAWSHDIALQSIAGENADGLTLLQSETLPYNIKPLTELVYQIDASSGGLPIIDATYVFMFDSATLEVRVIGRRSALFPFAPNWANPVSETLEWKTDILRSRDGSEQRRALRVVPRRGLEYDFLLQGDDPALLDKLLWSNIHRNFCVPIWTDRTLLTADAYINNTIIYCNTLTFGFRVGDALVIHADSRNNEVAQIVTVDETSIGLLSGLKRTWPAGTPVYPTMNAHLPSEVALQRHTDSVVAGRVAFQSSPHDTYDHIAYTMSYVGSASATSLHYSSMNVSLTALSGGEGLGVTTGDLVVVAVCCASPIGSIAGDKVGSIPTMLDASRDSYDTNCYQYLKIAKFIVGVLPDTRVVISGLETHSYAPCVAIVHVWRNVDPSVPIDASLVSASHWGGGSSFLSDHDPNPNPPSITPVTDGAVILAFGSASVSDASPELDIPDGMINGVSVSRSGSIIGSQKACLFVASKQWSLGSGPFDPPATTTGQPRYGSVWIAATLALRPSFNNDTFGRYEGDDVINIQPNWSNAIGNTVNCEFDTLDSGVGPVLHYDRKSFNSVTRQFGWLLKTRYDIRIFRGFLGRLQGRQHTCWVPTWHKDFVLAEGIESTGQTLVVKGTEFADLIGLDTSRDRLMIRTTSGVILYRRITAISVVDGNTVLTVDSIFNMTIQSSEARIYMLVLSRLASDKIEIPWRTTAIADPQTPFTSVKK